MFNGLLQNLTYKSCREKTCNLQSAINGLVEGRIMFCIDYVTTSNTHRTYPLDLGDTIVIW